MDKMKMQDTQLMQASLDTVSTIDDWSSVMGTRPTTNGTSSQGTASQGAKRPSWQGLRSIRVEFTPTTMCKLTSTCMIGSSLIHAHKLIYFVNDPLCTMCTKSILLYP